MSLKILILPTFIILELIIAVSYIKPNVSAIFAKRDEIAAAQGSLAKVESVEKNIQTLSGAIESRGETARFIERYYPKMLDEERIVDMFNFFALQSGIIITDVMITKIPFTRPPTAIDPTLGVSTEGLTPEALAAQAEAVLAVFPESYSSKITVLGAYPNIKNFFGRIYRADRLHVTREFSMLYLKKDENQAEEDAAKGIQDNFLVGSFQADFPYIVEKRVASALSNPIFESEIFDFSAADKATSFVKNPPAPIDASGGGKANPFE